MFVAAVAADFAVIVVRRILSAVVAVSVTFESDAVTVTFVKDVAAAAVAAV